MTNGPGVWALPPSVVRRRWKADPCPGVIAIIACAGFFLPYQSTIYLALYAGTGGKLFSHAQAWPAALAYGVWTIIAATLSVPVWRWMGLL